eukprot:c11999_g1_i4.p1 GENE.c11999_g1_i4~~c11999_g1_i4.p1  ORF type:complete len:278 (-),score=93.81 c11999_g1_i4:213-1046(-)
MSMVGGSSVIASVTRDGQFTVSARGDDADDSTDNDQANYVAANPQAVVSPKQKGWKRVTQCFPSLSRRKKAQTLLPPLSDEDIKKGRKTLVLDLDETLVHASFEPVDNPDFIIPVRLGRVVHKAYVRKRPGVDEFLTAMAPHYEIVVFTASLRKYADPVVDQLDPKGVVRYRLFRESCVQYCGNFIKDLSLLGRDLTKTIIIDNAPTSYLFHPNNALACVSWFDDVTDRELFEFIPVLISIAKFDDVTPLLIQIKEQREASLQKELSQVDDETDMDS